LPAPSLDEEYSLRLLSRKDTRKESEQCINEEVALLYSVCHNVFCSQNFHLVLEFPGLPKVPGVKVIN
jgi:hypothetical protein